MVTREKQNLGQGVYRAWAEGSQESGQNYSRATVFFDDRVVYSYGRHFPMGVRLDNGFILNADRYSATTNNHQGSVRTAAQWTGKPVAIISFSTLERAGVRPQYVEMVDVERDREIAVSCHSKWCKQPRPHTNMVHLLGRSVFRVQVVDDRDNFQAYRYRYFLSGTDETGRDPWTSYFLAELPCHVDSVADALEALKPEAVSDAEAFHLVVKRQGEWFFIPTGEGKLAGSSPWTGGSEPGDIPSSLLPHRNPARIRNHQVTELRVRGGKFYARGSVRHLNHEHKMLKLGEEWHEVHENTEVASFRPAVNAGGRGRVD